MISPLNKLLTVARATYIFAMSFGTETVVCNWFVGNLYIVDSRRRDWKDPRLPDRRRPRQARARGRFLAQMQISRHGVYCRDARGGGHVQHRPAESYR